MMSNSLDELWQTLSKELPSEGGALTAKKIRTDLTDKVHCAIDPDKQRHILILLAAGEDGLADVKSRGLTVQTRSLNVTGVSDETRKYIDIACNDTNGHLAFNLLTEEIVSFLGDKKLSPSDATSRVLEKWRKFWSAEIARYLGRAERIGLFAELWFLFKWLIPKEGADATFSWRGPFGDRNDFELGQLFVEVKATTSRRARIYHINGIDQLEVPRESVLYFFGARLMETENHGESIPGIISNIRQALVAHPEALDHLEEGLLEVGYSDIHEKDYKKIQFDVREERLYKVRDNFPRLQESRIEIPPGIERIEYEINLDTFDDLIVAKSPSEWSSPATSHVD